MRAKQEGMVTIAKDDCHNTVHCGPTNTCDVVETMSGECACVTPFAGSPGTCFPLDCITDAECTIAMGRPAVCVTLAPFCYNFCDSAPGTGFCQPLCGS
jgi:hypothetical protein